MRKVLAAAFISMLLALGACGSDSDSDDTTGTEDVVATGSTDLYTLCGKVFDCFDDDWGWDTQENCVSLWLKDCENGSDYLVCANTCVNGACEDFADCEFACWDEHCGAAR